MLNFSNDYAKGAHPLLLKALQEANNISQIGYGLDDYCKNASDKIRKLINIDDADIYFMSGGTQTNSTVIDAMLKSYEGVIAPKTGHISVHEAGAIEKFGHKVLTLPARYGKISAVDLKRYLSDFYNDGNYEHMVFPGMVYISYPTEYGTLYSADELEHIYNVCQEYKIPLFVDGARLGYALASPSSDIDLEFLSHNCDVFYIGGTKVGALFGEAIVFPQNNAPKHFYTLTKQHGAMLAKGWIIGLQFDALFTQNLYFDISKNALDRAEELKALLIKHHLPIYLLTETNQQFVVIENRKLEKLQKKVSVGFWEKEDESHTIVRFATSWYTTQEDILELDRILESI